MRFRVGVFLAVYAIFLFQKLAPVQATVQGELADLPSSDVDLQIQNWLNDGPGEVERLVRLGVDRETAMGFVDSFPENDVHAQWKSVHTQSRTPSAAMFLPCDGLDGANLYALKKGSGGWHVTDRMSFDCHYDESVSMEVASIHESNRDEVIIHQACEEHGTGFVQQNYNVFSLAEGKLRLKLDTAEVLDDHQPPEKIHDIVQRSTFTIIPILHSCSRAIEETRSSTLNDRLTVQRRVFRWDSTKGRYVPSRFTKVEFKPAG